MEYFVARLRAEFSVQQFGVFRYHPQSHVRQQHVLHLDRARVIKVVFTVCAAGKLEALTVLFTRSVQREELFDNVILDLVAITRDSARFFRTVFMEAYVNDNRISFLGNINQSG